MSLVSKIILAITATSTGLIAGLLYAFSCSVNLGLGRLNDTAYLSAMQNINKAILNPMFFFSFIGSAILLPVSTWMQFEKPMTLCFWLLLSATIIYLIGVIGVTMFGNVPHNDTLASFNISSASAEEIKLMRNQFETSWNTFHAYRTVASILSFILMVLACLNVKVN